MAATIPATVKGGTANIDTVLAVAVTIYCEWMAEDIPPIESNIERIDAAYKTYSKKYTDFMRSYPVPFRYIINLQYFNAGVFKEYLRGVATTLKKSPNNSWKSIDEFLTSQADYDRLMFIWSQSRATPEMIQDRYDAIIKDLRTNWDTVDKATKTATDQYDNDQAALVDRIKATLIEQSKAEHVATRGN